MERNGQLRSTAIGRAAICNLKACACATGPGAADGVLLAVQGAQDAGEGENTGLALVGDVGQAVIVKIIR